jgi:RNA polymerase subunit RPABC4/transcription elongation factor Spt4
MNTPQTRASRIFHTNTENIVSLFCYKCLRSRNSCFHSYVNKTSPPNPREILFHRSAIREEIMRKGPIVLGVAMITLGIIASEVLSIPVSYRVIVSGEPVTIRAGSSVPRAFPLPNDVLVSGTIGSVSGGGSGHDDIDFYVFDKNNYDNWINGQQNVRYVYIYRASSGAIFSFRTDRDADFCFVFDNPAGGLFGSDRSANWSASYEYKPYVPYTSLILASFVIVGALLIASDLIQRLLQRIRKLRTCPNCRRLVTMQTPVCPHCGFDVSKTLRCKYCHTMYDRSLPKCPNCGAKNN